jgi:hypothetical protein
MRERIRPHDVHLAANLIYPLRQSNVTRLSLEHVLHRRVTGLSDHVLTKLELAVEKMDLRKSMGAKKTQERCIELSLRY